MSFNSTIRQKVGQCSVCGKSGPLTKKMCHNHYWQSIKMKSVNKAADREDRFDDEDVATLKNDLDTIFSQYLRLSMADKNGQVSCYICGIRLKWQDAQNNHYIKRGNSFLRYDTRNCKVGCKTCNEIKGGNLAMFGRKLEQENPGITEILLEEGNLVYKFTRHELKQMIADYSDKLIILKQKNKTT
jgi:hypothetical protein